MNGPGTAGERVASKQPAAVVRRNRTGPDGTGLDVAGSEGPSGRLRALGQVLGNERLARLLRGELTVGAPAGAHEQAADRPPPGAGDERGAGARLHAGPESALAAAALGARAFTVGHDVHFARDQLRPGTEEGDRLLDHELAHVDQQRAGGAPDIQRQAADPDPDPEPEDDHADPDLPFAGARDPAGLDNEELLAEVSATKAWLQQHHMIELAYWGHEAYLAQLGEVRNARIRGGQVWMAEDSLSSAGQLFTLEPAPGGLAVIPSGGSHMTAGGAPGVVVFSRRQLDRTLRGLGIPTMTEAEAAMSGIVGSSLTTQPLQSRYNPMIDVFARRTNTSTIDTGFTGAMGEHTYGTRAPGASSRIDLNLQPWREAPTKQPSSGNFPIWDFREGTGELVQIKTSAAPTQKGRFDYFDTGFRDITRTASKADRRALFDTAVWNVDPSLPPPGGPLNPLQQAQWDQAKAEAIRRSRVAVNADDVPAYRTSLAGRIAKSPGTYRAVVEAYLAQQPVSAGGKTLTTLAQINAEPQPVRMQALRLLALRIVNQAVVENPVQTTGIQQFKAARTGAGLDPTGMGTGPRPSLKASTWPEYLAVTEHGYGPPMRGAALQGAKFGGPLSLVSGSLIQLARTGELPSGEDMAVLTTSGTIGGALAGPSEVAAQSFMSRAVQNTVLEGLPGLRGVGSGAVGGPLAALTQLGIMGYYDLTDPRVNFTGMDYAAKGGRAFVVGGLSAALTGALMGAPAGPAGVLAGFIVGVTLYLVTDALIGDSVEGSIRSIGPRNEPLPSLGR